MSACTVRAESPYIHLVSHRTTSLPSVPPLFTPTSFLATSFTPPLRPFAPTPPACNDDDAEDVAAWPSCRPLPLHPFATFARLPRHLVCSTTSVRDTTTTTTWKTWQHIHHTVVVIVIVDPSPLTAPLVDDSPFAIPLVCPTPTPYVRDTTQS